MRRIASILKLTAAALAAIALAAALAVLFWPLAASIAPVQGTNPDAVSGETRLVFAAGDHLTAQTARLLMRTDRSRGISRHLKHAALAARLALFTSRDRQATFLAVNSSYGFGHRDLSGMAGACFGTPPAELTLSQAAELAARARSPSSFAQSDKAFDLRQARDKLLQGLGEQGLITPAQVGKATAMPLGACH